MSQRDEQHGRRAEKEGKGKEVRPREKDTILRVQSIEMEVGENNMRNSTCTGCGAGGGGDCSANRAATRCSTPASLSFPTPCLALPIFPSVMLLACNPAKTGSTLTARARCGPVTRFADGCAVGFASRRVWYAFADRGADGAGRERRLKRRKERRFVCSKG